MAPARRGDPPALRRARTEARRIIERHFGTKPQRVAQSGGGQTNFVFLIQHAQGEFVVRIGAEAGKINAFIKEQWAMARAREAGVPTPEVLEVGIAADDSPYMVAHRVDGVEAVAHPARGDILRQLGAHAARINAIATTGIGETFDWSSNQLSLNATWREFLDKELRLDARLEVLERQRMLTPARCRKVRTLLRGLDGARARPVLTHGDLRLKNVIVGARGEIRAIIDWEHCTSNLAPYWELSIALHDLTIDEKEIFLAGYGLDAPRLGEIAPVLKALNLVNYVPEIERLAAAKDAAQLARYRLRLSGALDLHSL